MIVELAQKSALLMSNQVVLQHFAKDIEESYSPMLLSDFEQIKVISLEDAALIWREDPVPAAYRTSALAESQKQKNPWVAFREALAVTPQTTTLPHRFLSRIEQMRPLLFPHRRVSHFEMNYPIRRDGVLMAQNHRVLPDDGTVRMKTVVVEDYEWLRDWLLQLPLQLSELVYVARSPDRTLVMP